MSRREALWEIPEHVGWQIIHAGETLEGRRRKFRHSAKTERPLEFETFRDKGRDDTPEDTEEIQI